MKFLVFGLGYTASRFVQQNRGRFDVVTGTVRTADSTARLAADGFAALRFDGEHADPEIVAHLAEAQVLLVSVQPGASDDPVLARFGDAIAGSTQLRRIVYLSTIGVYGDHGGAWIDESAPPEPTNPRQVSRIAAEAQWQELGARTGKAVTVLRLAGIYGPGRNALDDLRNGEARRIDKPGQVFNRIHVDDIGSAIAASFDHEQGGLFNVTDDEPAPAPDVVAYAAELMGRTPPPLVPFDGAALSPMARSFYGSNRRVHNEALKSQRGWSLRYPTYRNGLDALWAAGEGRG